MSDSKFQFERVQGVPTYLTQPRAQGTKQSSRTRIRAGILGENIRACVSHALPCRGMQKKWNFYVKVLVIEEEEGDVQKDRLSREIARQLQKIYGVRSAEVTSVTIE